MQALSNKRAIAALLDSIADNSEFLDTIGFELMDSVAPFVRVLRCYPIIPVKGEQDPENKTDCELAVIPGASAKDSDAKAWAAILPYLHDPVIKAHLGYLLWKNKFGHAPKRYAQIAFCNYLRASLKHEKALSLVSGFLRRAISISIELKSAPLLHKALDMLIKKLEELLETDSDAETVQTTLARAIPSKRALEVLPKNLKNSINTQVVRVLQRIIEKYRGCDPHTYKEFCDILSEWNPNRAKDIQHDVVEAFLKEADTATGWYRHLLLSKACEIAHQAKLTHLLPDIQNRLLNCDDLPWKTCTFVIVSKPGSCQQKGWRDIFDSVAKECPISKEYLNDPALLEKNQLLASSAIDTCYIDSRNMPIYKSQGEGRCDELQHLVKVPGICAFAADLCDSFSRLGPNERPTEAELVDYFHCEHIPIELATKVSKALVSFWEEKYDQTCCHLYRLIEPILKELALKRNIVPYETQKDGTQKPWTLGQLLRKSSVIKSDPWRQYFQILLTDKRGLDLRNKLAHGDILNPGPLSAALLIHAACVLRKIDSDEGITEPV